MRFDPNLDEVNHVVEIPGMEITSRDQFDKIMAKLSKQVATIWPKPVTRRPRKPKTETVLHPVGKPEPTVVDKAGAAHRR